MFFAQDPPGFHWLSYKILTPWEFYNVIRFSFALGGIRLQYLECVRRNSVCGILSQVSAVARVRDSGNVPRFFEIDFFPERQNME